MFKKTTTISHSTQSLCLRHKIYMLKVRKNTCKACSIHIVYVYLLSWCVALHKPTHSTLHFPSIHENTSPQSFSPHSAPPKAQSDQKHAQYINHKSPTSLLQIHIFTLLHHYRTKPRKGSPPRTTL